MQYFLLFLWIPLVLNFPVFFAFSHVWCSRASKLRVQERIDYILWCSYIWLVNTVHPPAILRLNTSKVQLSLQETSSAFIVVPSHNLEMCISSSSPFVWDHGWHTVHFCFVFQTESFCETVGCQNDGVCHENCETLFFPHMICKCPVLFTGAFCERRKIGKSKKNYDLYLIALIIDCPLILSVKK